MGAARAAPLLHEPEFRVVRRIKRNRGMSNGVCLAKLRERERILGALQRFGAVAYYPRPAGNCGERFRLMLETRAIDEPNRIIGVGERFNRAGHFVERHPIDKPAVERHGGAARLSRIVVAKDVDRERRESGTGRAASKRARRIGHDDDFRTINHRPGIDVRPFENFAARARHFLRLRYCLSPSCDRSRCD